MRLPELDAWCRALERRGAAMVRLRGTSMTPAIRDGQIVCVVAESPRAGQVAVLRVGDRLVCHRQVWRSRDRISLVGAGIESYAVPREARVVGRVTARLRRGRFESPGNRWLGLMASLGRLLVRGVWR